MRPRVLVFNAISADGRIDWFAADAGLYYELAGRWGEDCTLVGSETILRAPGDETPAETPDDAEAPPPADPNDKRAIMAVVDTRGRVKTWDALRKWGYWRAFVSIGSKSTPLEHIEYLRSRHVDTITAGDTHAGLAAALDELAERFGVTRVRVDSGGTLNGALLRAGLVDEVWTLVHPALVGGTTPQTMYRAPDLAGPEGVIPMKLTGLETIGDGVAWLRWEVSPQ